MTERTTPAGLRRGDRIRLLSAGTGRECIDPPALAILDAAVGGIHPIDHVDEFGAAWIAFQGPHGNWHTFSLHANDYEKAD